MTHGNRIVGVALATAALFIAGTGVSNADTAMPSAVKSKCYGGNACKGQSECKTTTNACKGQNARKGEGFTFAATVLDDDRDPSVSSRLRLRCHSTVIPEAT